MRYFFHKLGAGNTEVKKYLGNANAGDTGQIAIFFGESTVEECLNGEHGKDAQEFCLAAQSANRKNTRIILVANREFWVLQPAGDLTHGTRVSNKEGGYDISKLMPVRVLVRKPVEAVPHLLASMASNAYWSRGTFREIGKQAPDKTGVGEWDGWPHQVAIELQLPEPIRQLRIPRINDCQLLRFLSSVELETLVAKLFEEAGCFVPAYRGGSMADVDILARNDSNTTIVVGNHSLAVSQSLAIQVKSWMRSPHRVIDGILSVSLNLHSHDRGKGWDESTLWQNIQNTPCTALWLARSLSWLPQDLHSQLTKVTP